MNNISIAHLDFCLELNASMCTSLPEKLGSTEVPLSFSFSTGCVRVECLL